MNIKTFCSDALGFGVANFLTKGAQLLIVPLVTRSLSPTDYGTLEIIIGLGGIAAVLVSLSLESYIARQWGELTDTGDRAMLFSGMCTLVLFMGVLVGVTACFLSPSISSGLFTSSQYSIATSLIIANGAVVALLGLPLIVLRMERALKAYLVVVALQSFIYLLVILWLFDRSAMSVSSVVLAVFASSLASLLVSLLHVRKYLTPQLDLSWMRPALRYSLPLLPAVGATWINSQVAKYTLLYFIDAKTVGEFAVVTKVAAVVTMGVMVFRQAWLPYSFNLARRPDHGKRQFRQVMNSYYGIGLSICFVFVLFSKSIIGLLAPPEYEIDLIILPILLLASLVYGSASIVNIGMLVSGKTEWNSYAAFIGVALNIVLTVVLVPILGVAGAAWGTLVAAVIFVFVLAARTKFDLDVSFGVVPSFLIAIYLIFSLMEMEV